MAEEVISAESHPCRYDELAFFRRRGRTLLGPRHPLSSVTTKNINPFPKLTTKKMDQPDRENRISDELLLKVSKEITIKFIEVGRIIPANFEVGFDKIYHAIQQTVRKP